MKFFLMSRWLLKSIVFNSFLDGFGLFFQNVFLREQNLMSKIVNCFFYRSRIFDVTKSLGNLIKVDKLSSKEHGQTGGVSTR